MNWFKIFDFLQREIFPNPSEMMGYFPISSPRDNPTILKMKYELISRHFEKIVDESLDSEVFSFYWNPDYSKELKTRLANVKDPVPFTNLSVNLTLHVAKNPKQLQSYLSPGYDVTFIKAIIFSTNDNLKSALSHFIQWLLISYDLKLESFDETFKAFSKLNGCKNKDQSFKDTYAAMKSQVNAKKFVLANHIFSAVTYVVNISLGGCLAYLIMRNLRKPEDLAPQLEAN